MAVTSAEVARVAGVSRPAVSQILNGRGRFSAETIQRVEEAASSLNYRPSAAARTLATGQSDVVIALVPNTTFGTNLQDVTDALTKELARNGLTLVLRLSSSPIDLFEHFISTVRPRAVITPFAPPTDPERKAITASGVMLIDLQSTLSQDVNYRIGQLQGEYLVSQGYRAFAYAHLRDTRLDVYGHARERGFTDQITGSGFANAKSLRCAISLPDGIRALENMTKGIAVACYNDDVAIALVAAARDQGWGVPDDIAIMGVDATQIGALVSPSITSVSADIDGSIRDIMPIIVDRVTASPVERASPGLPTLQIVHGKSA